MLSGLIRIHRTLPKHCVNLIVALNPCDLLYGLDRLPSFVRDCNIKSRRRRPFSSSSSTTSGSTATLTSSPSAAPAGASADHLRRWERNVRRGVRRKRESFEGFEIYILYSVFLLLYFYFSYFLF